MNDINCHIILVGTELLNGMTVDTNSIFIAEELNKTGINLTGKSIVGDSIKDINEILKNIEDKNDLIIISGGIGPTVDDVTREAVSKYYNLELILNEKELEKLKLKFIKSNIKMSENNKRQVYIPNGSRIIENKKGSALAFYINKIAVFPGVPSELKETFKAFITNYAYENKLNQNILFKDILFWGIPESKLEPKILDILRKSNIEFEFLAKQYGLILRLIYDTTLEKYIENLKIDILERVGKYYFGEDEQRLETVIANILIKKDLKISIAESCTGGMISSQIVNLSGASNFFKESIVCYSNDSKVRRLNVNERNLEKFGAVSEEVVNEMLIGLKTDIGIAVSGIAGPNGGTIEKPVGTVYIGIKIHNENYIKKYNFPGDRERVRWRATNTALKDLIDKLKEMELDK